MSGPAPTADRPVNRPTVDPGALPPLPLRSRAERVSGANVGRWASFGCVALMLVFVVLLLVGVNLTKRTLWSSFARAQQRLVEELPRDLPSGERLRTERNLQLLRARIEAAPDPLPLIGGFLGRVSEALDDGRLTAGEVADINRVMEQTIDGTGDDLG
ncbi:MAG TPA: hypothetical protein PKJ99_08990 [Thermoanaerobaculales bacterium]|nr:hypothetical protein [Thermoanaerobaculales bacterium]HPA82979.1 hypothetical protein [Thermoanaerobaculales bacterium]HQN96813.1 hypothetical protein [Thermoanaerobaculales bacterium]HQP43248.1 hypothetical protein [Thermoanaerobaculales bacterium]